MKKRLLALLLVIILALSSLSACDLTKLFPITPTPPSGESINDDCIDEDNNGYCDDCGTYVVVTLDFYTINDIHGKLFDTDDNVGADELSTYLKTMMSLDDRAVLLSSGDMWQGSAESSLTRGLMMTDWMNYMNFDAMALGNHEYDWGEEYVIANNEVAEFPILAINVFDNSTNQRADYCDASVVVEKDGLKIGIIGAIGDCYSSISADMSKNFYFKTGSELSKLIKDEADRLRREEGVDFIALSLHDGHDQNKSKGTISSSDLRAYYDISLSRGYVDVVFEAHTHKSYILTDSEGIYHIQAGGENSGIAHAEFSVNYASNKSKVNTVEIVSDDTYKAYADDSIIFELTEKYPEQSAKATEIIGTLDRTVYSNEIADLVARLYCQKGVEVWGDKYNIMLGGGFISTRSPYNMSRGTVAYSDVYSVLPFDNQLVLCSILGKDLKKVFIETTNTKYHVSYTSFGYSMLDYIEPYETYYVVTDTYTSTYSYNNLTEIQRLDEKIYARDLLSEYIKAGKLK